jgi:hypothetical protein
VLTPPTAANFNRVTVNINGGPNDDATDFFPIQFAFDEFGIGNLTDQDIDDLVQVIVRRVIADHPNYTLRMYRSWQGGINDGSRVLYAPPAPEPGA